jgi:hypothetical protein
MRRPRSSGWAVKRVCGAPRSEALTKNKPEYNAKKLNDFDAVLFYAGGELEMNGEQKAALRSFVRFALVDADVAPRALPGQSAGAQNTNCDRPQFFEGLRPQ